MRIGLGFRFGQSQPPTPNAGMTSLVDVLLSTIGIFVIIFALQEIARPTDRVPGSFDGAILCDDEGRYILHNLDGATETLDISDLAGSLGALVPAGGRFLVGISAGCATTEIRKGVTAISPAYGMRSELGLQTDPTGEAIHQFEIAPLDSSANSFSALLSRIRVGDE